MSRTSIIHVHSTKCNPGYIVAGSLVNLRTLYYLQTAKSGVYSDVWKGMTSHSDSIVDGSDAGFLKTARENYAFIGDKTYLGSYAAGHCDLILLPEEFYKVGFGFALPQDWPYSAYVNDV